MSVLVTDDGFVRDDYEGAILELSADMEPDVSVLDATLIRVTFANFADGRGFTIAKRLRLMGYQGRLRASGPLIADQYAMIRRAGFDEVEIPQEMAKRQPEAQWLRRAQWRSHDYQSRLRATA